MMNDRDPFFRAVALMRAGTSPAPTVSFVVQGIFFVERFRMLRRFVVIVCGLLVSGVAALPQGGKVSPALASLVETERAFARRCGEVGVRDSFIEFFAEDGVNFMPAPTKTREAFMKRPAQTTRTATLNWRPAYADVSLAGDLGYTTGPVVQTDNARKNPPRYSYYFSVWRKQRDGSWKVELDLGVETPADDPSPFRAAPQTGWRQGRAKTDPAAAGVELMRIEREFSQVSESRGVTRAFASYGSEAGRLHRNGLMPVEGTRAVGAYLSQKVSKYSWQPTHAGVAASNDLGYTYGSYELAWAQKPGATERGYYARVWKRDAKGRWKVVADITHPVAPEQK
jgi:ketosteroid isomerase-like protein